jgi:hypothetical protein
MEPSSTHSAAPLQPPALVADQLKRNAILIELNEDYRKIIEQRLAKPYQLALIT